MAIFTIEFTKAMFSPNLKFFIVQRSEDAINYTPICLIQFDESKKEYIFTDKNSEKQNWFYRIVEVEMSGVGTFSGAVSIEKPVNSTK